MNKSEQQEYLERYKKAKEKGVPFFPDILFKDAVVSLVIFLVLIGLAYFLGAPLEARADPADTAYTPRPEWYFLFLFQMLKYFPGELEVVGVFVLPTLAILLLLGLPFLDRGARRHFLNRPVITVVTLLGVAGMGLLTVQSIREAPPPTEVAQGDQVAALYTENCAACHGATITVPEGTNLHSVIALGKHEGMPAWNADLTTDEIDALAGFILSPAGSEIFTRECGDCHEASELVAGDPLELKKVLEQAASYPAHSGLNLPDWAQTLRAEERTELLNFLIAPDGQRLFATNCAACHGKAVAFAGEEPALREIIARGGLHLDMPPWQTKLSDVELDRLALYVVTPAQVPEGQDLFSQFCASCHGERIPVAADLDQAREIIAGGGPHQTMPVWGSILTPEQLDALVSFTLSAAEGTSLEVGQSLFGQNCTPCHGDFGEGGPNPTRQGDVIAPISTSEYLKTRDDFTLRAIVSQGQPNFGMSPFGTAFGGPLDDEEVDAIVAYMRSWEAKPPVELPPEVSADTVGLNSAQVYAEVCAQCHGARGEGTIGPTLVDQDLQAARTDQELFDTINQGHASTAMIGWGEVLTADQIQQLVVFIRSLQPVETEPQPGATVPSFASDLSPILKAKCVVCHGALGGWDASSYTAVMGTGDNAPVVIPGDADNSLLAQKLLGTHTEGTIMPPAGQLPPAEIQLFVDWILAGAPDN